MASAAVAPEKPLPARHQKALARLAGINSLPEVTTRIVQMAEDPHVTVHDMDRAVRADPALAAKILKVVNSAFYGLPARVASLDRAILMLGLSAVKNITLAASLARLFKAEMLSEHFTARDLWRHCVATGVCARLVANAAGLPHADEVFAAGLMHDLGLIAIHQLFPQRLREIVERCHREACSFRTVEEQVLGADHQAFGAALAAQWHFPSGLRAAVGWHHDPSGLPAEFRAATAAIYVADTLCSQARHGFWLTAQDQSVDACLPLLRLSPARLAEATADLAARVEEGEQIFAT
ncbi:MAG: HDOD domain-containing protein [Planctomycetota bacterium]